MKKPTKVFIALMILIGGLLMVFSLNNPDINHKSEEELRNYEYEVSLVKALKNSYKGIEEITITNPHYTIPPGNWHCEVSIKFLDGETIFFGTNYSLEEKTFSTGGIKRKNIAGWEYLEANKGETDWEVSVSYSDGEKGYQ